MPISKEDIPELLQETVETIRERKKELSSLIELVVSQVDTKDSMVLLGTTIKDFYAALLKNDSHLVQTVNSAIKLFHEEKSKAQEGGEKPITEDDKLDIIKKLKKDIKTTDISDLVSRVESGIHNIKE